MKKLELHHSHEKIVAQALAPIAKELRLIDVADLIALLRFEKHGNLSDLVTSAAELYFLPDTVRLGSGGDYVVNWDNDPKIHLDLEIILEDIVIYVRLTLEKDCCSIEINHIDFTRAVTSHQEGAERITSAFEHVTFNAHHRHDMPEFHKELRATL